MVGRKVSDTCFISIGAAVAEICSEVTSGRMLANEELSVGGR